MVDFILYDSETGRIAMTGNAPASQIELQAQEYPELTLMLGEANFRSQYIDDGQIVDMPAKPSATHVFDYVIKEWVEGRTLAEARETAIKTLNKQIVLVRAKYITIIPGQESIYQAKEAEAVRYIADATPDVANYPLISAEIGITATTAYEIAQIWLYMSEQWRTIAATLEAIRLTAKDSVMNAVDVNGVDAVLAVALDELASY